MNKLHTVCRLTELKFSDDKTTDAMHFSGYAAAFGNIDAYGDVIEPGAFAQFLSDANSGKQPWPAMLSQHGGMMSVTAEDMTPVGVWTSLVEDGAGLKAEGMSPRVASPARTPARPRASMRGTAASSMRV